MTTDLRLFDITLDATGDNTNNQFKAVVASSGTVAGGFAVVATLGGRFIGVLQDKSTASGISSLVRVAGITKMAAGASSGDMTAAINEGDPVVSSSKGRAIPSTAAGLAKVGTALDSLAAASSFAVIKVLLGVGLTT